MRRPTPLLLFVCVLGCKCSDLDPGPTAVAPPASSASSSSSSAPSAPSPPSGATPAQIRAFCAFVFDSLGSGALSKCTPVDKQREGWAALAAQVQYDIDRCSDALEDGARVDVGADALPTCEAKLRALVDSDDPSIDATAACDPIARGKQAEGAPCIDQVQCAAGLACVGDASKTEGACRKPRTDGKCEAPFDVLEATALDRQCGAEAYCNPDTQGCAARKKKGDACPYDEACGRGLLCVMHVCAERKSQTGDACRDDLDCVHQDFCDTKAGTCAEKTKAGWPCTDDRSCRGRCADGRCTGFCGSG